MPSSRQRKLDAVVARLQRQYGPTAARKAAPIVRLSTTFAELDRAARRLPRGRLTKILDPGQDLVTWLDLPRTSDPDYLHCCDIDLIHLPVMRPRDGADA